jgi:hypothetical protein
MKIKLWGLFVFLSVCSSLRAQDTITVTCSEDYYLADAQFSVTIDGASVTNGTACTARNSPPGTPPATLQISTFKGSWGGTSATHAIVVTFLNDAYGGSAALDRNLIVWGVSYNGLTPVPIAGAGGQCPAYINGKGALLNCTGSNATWTTTAQAVAPVITAQPSAQTVFVGQSATFSVVATGANTFQWERNGTVIVGATAANYSTPATTKPDNGTYFSVQVSNGTGTTTSLNVMLTVNPYVGNADNGNTNITSWVPTESALQGCGVQLTCTTSFSTQSGNSGILAVTGLTTQAQTVGLAWQPAVTTPGMVAPTQFNIYRSTTTGANYVQIGHTAGLVSSYTDTPPAHAITYYYVVTAAAPLSSCLSATAQPIPCESAYSNESSILWP